MKSSCSGHRGQGDNSPDPVPVLSMLGSSTFILRTSTLGIANKQATVSSECPLVTKRSSCLFHWTRILTFPRWLRFQRSNRKNLAGRNEGGKIPSCRGEKFRYCRKFSKGCDVLGVSTENGHGQWLKTLATLFFYRTF